MSKNNSNNSYNSSYNNLNNEPTDNSNNMTYVLVRPFYRWYYDNWYPYFWGSGGGGGYYTNHRHRKHRPFRYRQGRNDRNNNNNLSYGGKRVSRQSNKISVTPHKQVSRIRNKISGNINKFKRNASALRYRLQSSNNTLTPVKPTHRK